MLRAGKLFLYLFAIAVSLVTLWVRLQLGAFYGSRPLLIIFMLPIILGAMLGGLGPGVAATLTCAVGIGYWNILPIGNFTTAYPHDLFQGALLIVNGILVSALSEGLHHSYRQLERHQRELSLSAERLRQNEYRLRLAQDVAHAGTWDWQPGTDQNYWSAELWALFGLTPGSHAPTLKGWLETVHPDDREAVNRRLQTALAPGETYEIEWRMNAPPGTPARWILSRGQRIDGPDSRGARYLGIMIDISERKRAEAEISRLNADLEQRVLERTAELSGANRELDAFAYAVSHDLRAPLRAMSGLSQIVKEDYAHLLPDEARKYLTEIDVASRRMGELIDALLALSRSTRGDLQFDTVDVSGIARRLADEMAELNPQQPASMQIEPGLKVRGDARLIEVVMHNLLGNAWKYSAHTASPNIKVFAQQEAGHRFICVADNGAGFDMAYAGKLFQPFQRLHRQDEFPGIGIGLATVQRIVHRHGGLIDARGKPGEGATFRFSLPESVAYHSAGITEVLAS
jgi:PAS domain S-box-containing protein